MASDRKKSDRFEIPIDLLNRAGITNGEITPAIRSDLVGEYFVYHWLFENPRRISGFLNIVWNYPLPTWVFFDRLFSDYGYLLNENPEQWESLFPQTLGKSLPEESVIIYAMLLVNSGRDCNSITQYKKQVEQLKDLSFQYPDNQEIAVIIAIGWVYLSYRQDQPEASGSIQNLKNLSNAYPDNQIIKDLLAKLQ